MSWNRRSATILGTVLLHTVWRRGMCGPIWKTTAVRIHFLQLNDSELKLTKKHFLFCGCGPVMFLMILIWAVYLSVKWETCNRCTRCGYHWPIRTDVQMAPSWLHPQRKNRSPCQLTILSQWWVAAEENDLFFCVIKWPQNGKLLFLLFLNRIYLLSASLNLSSVVWTGLYHCSFWQVGRRMSGGGGDLWPGPRVCSYRRSGWVFLFRYQLLRPFPTLSVPLWEVRSSVALQGKSAWL